MRLFFMCLSLYTTHIYVYIERETDKRERRRRERKKKKQKKRRREMKDLGEPNLKLGEALLKLEKTWVKR